MTLSQLLIAMKNNANVNITLTEADGSSLITFNASGYASIESDILSRTVDTITVKNAQSITVKLVAVISG